MINLAPLHDKLRELDTLAVPGAVELIINEGIVTGLRTTLHITACQLDSLLPYLQGPGNARITARTDQVDQWEVQIYTPLGAGRVKGSGAGL